MKRTYDLFLIDKVSTIQNQRDYWITLSSDQKIKCNFNDIQSENFVGFLGFDLSAIDAFEVYENISLVGGKWAILPSDYRDPQFTIEQAYEIAKLEAIKLQKTKFSSYQFNPVSCTRSRPMYWGFLSSSEQLIQEGYCPGGVTVLVDKIDGHIWTLEEQSCVFGETYHLELIANQNPKNILDFLAVELELKHSIDREEYNKECIQGKGMLLGATEHTYSKIVQRMFGILPNIHIWFRLNPPYYKPAYLLMLNAVQSLLKYSNDCIFLSDRGYLLPILKKTSEELILNKNYDPWTRVELEQISSPYRFEQIVMNK